MTVRCDVATKSADSVNAAESDLSEEENEAKAKVGSLIRVTAPLKGYHVNPIPEVDL
uniref:Ferredoxin thioredoxin reductase alpha chain domain-containing protein n=1 Tax=Brassica oleracea var. oleracea TaxID=109376 RepID=A0A0D3E3N9_BRAOL